LQQPQYTRRKDLRLAAPRRRRERAPARVDCRGRS
jgi:hypothetical protein